MTRYFSLGKLVMVLAITALTIGFTAFSQKQKDGRYSFRNKQNSGIDSSTSGQRNRNVTSGDRDKLEEAMQKLDQQMQQLDEQMQKLDMQLNTDLKEVNEQKISQQIDEAMSNVDWEKINGEIEKSKAALDKVNIAQIKTELARAKAELAKHKTEQLQAARIDHKKIRAEVEEAMKKARVDMEKAKEELANLQAFTSELDKDGLIDKSKGYKIEVKENELYINGQKQSKEISEKYKKYYKKSNFTINMRDDDNTHI